MYAALCDLKVISVCVEDKRLFAVVFVFVPTEDSVVSNLNELIQIIVVVGAQLL